MFAFDERNVRTSGERVATLLTQTHNALVSC